MTFATPPSTSKKQINYAGKRLVNGTELSGDLDLVNSWRAAHAYPMNTFRSTLHRNTVTFKGEPVIAQRLKRMPTIIDKLSRFPTMQVTTMQDIGGLRAILDNIADVYKLADQYKEKSRFKHFLHNENDHINEPRSEDGYRSLHLIYKYRGSNNEARLYNDLFIELQIRTKLQHSWATAVETMGTMLDQALKSRQGEKNWLKFFALTSSLFAYQEQTAPVFPELSRDETIKQVLTLEKKLDVINRLNSLSVVVDNVDNKKWSYHLIILYPGTGNLRVESFSRDQTDLANSKYLEYEKRATSGEKIEPVLVSAGPIDELRKAYPNFFLDTEYFIQNFNQLTN